MAAINKSIYEELILESNDQKRTIDIRQGTIMKIFFHQQLPPRSE